MKICIYICINFKCIDRPRCRYEIEIYEMCLCMSYPQVMLVGLLKQQPFGHPTHPGCPNSTGQPSTRCGH